MIIGDPESMPHPVRLIGKCIQAIESWVLRYSIHKKAAGIFIGLCVPAAAFAGTLVLVKLAGALHPVVEAGISAVIIYTCLSTRSLGSAALRILKKLRRGDMTAARKALACIVGRDTAELDQSAIVRATVESVSENTVDGIISPLFYAFLGGAPLAMAYKAVNTLDSMIGYKNEQYLHLGWFSARLDDLANYIPARLTLFVVPVAAVFLRPSRMLKIVTTGLRDGAKSPSPNAGYPEACFAGALGIQLGGECCYEGISSPKPCLGNKERENETEDILRAVCLMWLVSGCSLVFFTGMHILANNL